MSWNYRVVKRLEQDPSCPYTYSIHEAHYDDDGQVIGITEGSIEPNGETSKELKKDLETMLIAFDKPILNYEDF